MKKIVFSMISLIFMFSFCLAAERDFFRSENSYKGKSKNHALGSPVVIKMRQYNIPRPTSQSDSSSMFKDENRQTWPTHSNQRNRIVQQTVKTPPIYHTKIVSNQIFINKIEQQRKVEIIPDRYYWHKRDGSRFVHYFHNGIHWYGFYHEDDFYWCRFYNGWWWWFDPSFDRWVYWYNGYWWWTAPTKGLFMFILTITIILMMKTVLP